MLQSLKQFTIFVISLVIVFLTWILNLLVPPLLLGADYDDYRSDKGDLVDDYLAQSLGSPVLVYNRSGSGVEGTLTDYDDTWLRITYVSYSDRKSYTYLMAREDVLEYCQFGTLDNEPRVTDTKGVNT